MRSRRLANGFARKLHVLTVAAVLAGMAWSVAPGRVARAVIGTWDVTKQDDTDDGACDADCSLREAIKDANDHSGHDIINIPAGTYVLDLTGSGDDTNATGDLDITDDVTINGAGEETTIIDGNGTDRVLHVFSSATVVVNDVTIRNGKADDG
jgi:CSLREA domain-containing protein